MGRESIEGLTDYLRRLAPGFFGERMRGASAQEIARLENAAGAPLSESHRAFLSAAGATPAQALNPFLNDRDYCVATLLSAYAELDDEGIHLCPGIVYFSSSEINSETIFLRHAERVDMEPEVGDVRFDTGEFIPKAVGRFESWLRRFAFVFRVGQPDHQRQIVPPWDETTGRWRGEPDQCWKLLESLGFHLIFSLDDGTRCADTGAVAAMIRPDGSGSFAADDTRELRRVQAVLQEHIEMRIRPVPERDRLRAPRY